MFIDHFSFFHWELSVYMFSHFSIETLARLDHICCTSKLILTSQYLNTMKLYFLLTLCVHCESSGCSTDSDSEEATLIEVHHRISKSYRLLSREKLRELLVGFFCLNPEITHITRIHISLDRSSYVFTPNCREWEM